MSSLIAFVWVTRLGFLMTIVYRDEHPENLQKVLKKTDSFPALDVFICTVDPYKEPPMRLVSTASSIMAYGYLMEKISVYVSNDWGSELTLFAYVEALRVSATPQRTQTLILTLDRDIMYSNDPQTPLRALCYLLDSELRSQLSYKRPFQTNPLRLDGLLGSNYIKTDCFFSRRAFFGGPSYIEPPAISQLGPNRVRPAFLGDAPISLINALNQLQRWIIGALQASVLWALSWALPTCITPPSPYIAFLPQLALLHGLGIFPKISNPWFLLYVFLFLGAYGQDLLEFMVAEGTVQRWWNNQGMWMKRGFSCCVFGFLEYFLKCLGISTYGFGLTSKVVDDEQSKRYAQGIFEFGFSSPILLVPFTTGAIINLASFLTGLTQVLRGISNVEGLFLQIFIAGFVVVNSLPIYEAIVLRSDRGRMPLKTAIISTGLAFALYMLFSLIPLRN
ncbi:hypothetical protein I3843_12G080300 [Carya illinoinensis]|nr:hypothetical protein I3843_12G080300 [Carya illinoinensis]